MRVILPLALTSALLAAGCGDSEEAIRGELRKQVMQGCAAEIAPTISDDPDFDATRFCACVAAKAVAGSSREEVKQLLEDKQRARQAGAECLAEQTPPPLAPPPESRNTGAEFDVPPEREEAKAKVERAPARRPPRSEPPAAAPANRAAPAVPAAPIEPPAQPTPPPAQGNAATPREPQR